MTIISIQSNRGEFFYSRDVTPGSVAFTANIHQAAIFDNEAHAQAFRGSNSFGNALAESFDRCAVVLTPVEVRIRRRKAA